MVVNDPEPPLLPPAAAMPGSSSVDGSSLDGSSSGPVGGPSVGATALTTQRRSLGTPMKRVQSRVPVNDVQDQPLLSQAKKLLDDQRTK